MMTEAGKAFQHLQEEACTWFFGVRADRVRLFREGRRSMTEEMRPGYLLRVLTTEQCEALKGLTSDEVARLALRPDRTLY